MFASRSLLRTLGRLLLAVMLFAQYAVAAQACVMPRHAPLVTGTVQEAAHHCHEMAMEKMSAPAEAPMSANLCAAQAGDQSADVPAVTIHALPALPVLSVVLTGPVLPDPKLIVEAAGRHPGDPPIPILFQVFRS